MRELGAPNPGISFTEPCTAVRQPKPRDAVTRAFRPPSTHVKSYGSSSYGNFRPPQGPSFFGSAYARHLYYLCKLVVPTKKYFLIKSYGSSRYGNFRPPQGPSFCLFFASFFGPVCVRISYVIALKRGFFCNVEKVYAKDPLGYVGMRPP